MDQIEEDLRLNMSKLTKENYLVRQLCYFGTNENIRESSR